MTARNLEPLSPSAALEWYLEDRRAELRTATWRKHASALGVFVDWTDEVSIDNLNELGGRKLLAFKTWRKTQSELCRVSLNGNLAILRTFLQFCESIEAVPDDIHERVPLPNVPPDEEVDAFVPSDETVEAIRSYLRDFEYASRQHVEFDLIAEVGLRMGAVRGIDVDDLDLDAMVVQLRHRPESTGEYGTPLKNGSDGERLVNISTELAETITAYIEYHRPAITDKFDRKPLLTTSAGRVTTTTMRRDFYKLSRPCTYTNDCPHNRDISGCDATKSRSASQCPSSFSTHPLRKWSIMHQLDEGVPKELLSDRVDVSVPVLDKHYDQRSEERKSRRRREVLESNLGQYAMTDGGRRVERGEER